MQPTFVTPAARDLTVNALLMLRRLGFSHWLLLMHSEAWCDEASAIFGGDSGCVHFDPAVAPYRALYHSVRKSPMSRATWFFRVLGLVRLARTGVNVFMLDADCVLLHDWYRVPAAFPSVHLWTLQDHASPANVNTGTYYMRGVHRDGPVLWALYQMIEWVRVRAPVPTFLSPPVSVRQRYPYCTLRKHALGRALTQMM